MNPLPAAYLYVPIAILTIIKLNILQKTLSFFLVFLLASCANLPSEPESAIDNQSHQATLADITQWKIKGRMAFSNNNEKVSAYVNWQQKSDDYTIVLTNIIGSTLLQMEGNTAFAKMDIDDKTYVDRNAQQLLLRVTGWNIPVDGFPLWIKGMAANDADNFLTYGESGLVAKVANKNGWNIDYQNYQKVDNIWLPKNIKFKKDEHQVKIRINEWTLN